MVNSSFAVAKPGLLEVNPFTLLWRDAFNWGRNAHVTGGKPMTGY